MKKTRRKVNVVVGLFFCEIIYRFFKLVSENEDQEEETRSIADSFMNPSMNSIDYSACCLSSATNVTNRDPSANGKENNTFSFSLK